MASPLARSRPHAASGYRSPVPVLGLAAVLISLLVAFHVALLTRTDASVEAQAHAAVLASPALLEAARVATVLGGGYVRVLATAFVVLVLLLRRRIRLAAFLVVAVAGGAAVNETLKALVHRARPVLPDPVASATGLSFPSGHAMGAAVLVGALLVITLPALARRAAAVLAAVGAIFVAAVAASRVLLGVHYLTDVIAGILFGALWVLACAAAFRVPAPLPVPVRD